MIILYEFQVHMLMLNQNAVANSFHLPYSSIFLLLSVVSCTFVVSFSELLWIIFLESRMYRKRLSISAIGVKSVYALSSVDPTLWGRYRICCYCSIITIRNWWYDECMNLWILLFGNFHNCGAVNEISLVLTKQEVFGLNLENGEILDKRILDDANIELVRPVNFEYLAFHVSFHKRKGKNKKF